MNRQKLRKGFTLVEIIVVMMIIAILAAMVIPRIMHRTSDAKVTAAKNDIATMKTALTDFRVDCDHYPSSEQGLEALRTQPDDAKGWRGPYIEGQVPLDPWGNPYAYEQPGQNGDDSYNLYSFGADGAEGGDGENADIGLDR